MTATIPPYIFIRLLSVIGLVLFTWGFLVWMIREGEVYKGFPVLGAVAHWLIYYSIYLWAFFYQHPIPAGFFLNWASIIFFQSVYTGVLIIWDMVTGLFSHHLADAIAKFIRGRAVRE